MDPKKKKMMIVGALVVVSIVVITVIVVVLTKKDPKVVNNKKPKCKDGYTYREYDNKCIKWEDHNKQYIFASDYDKYPVIMSKNHDDCKQYCLDTTGCSAYKNTPINPKDCEIYKAPIGAEYTIQSNDIYSRYKAGIIIDITDPL
jgi:hypothetical protein